MDAPWVLSEPNSSHMPIPRKTAQMTNPTKAAQGTWLRLLCLPALRTCSDRVSGASGSLVKAPPAGILSPFSKSGS